jgi:L-lactate dehydrogenase complex protein LldF
MLYPELAALSDESVVKNGRRLDHAEGTSHPIRTPSEPQPRGARVRGNRRVSQSEAANRFIAATQHE